MQYVIIAVLTIVFAFLVWNRWFRKTETPTVTPVGRYITDDDLEAFLKDYRNQAFKLGYDAGKKGRSYLLEGDEIHIGHNVNGWFAHTHVVDLELEIKEMPKRFQANNIIPVEPSFLPEQQDLTDYGIG